jgi:acetoin:2,6-dichlorophenolindophenol oxidoreductase subunit alpha
MPQSEEKPMSEPQSFLRKMVQIRAVEQSLLALFSEGFIRGTVHTCLGQEAIPVGVVAALDPSRDVVCSNHRGHGHFLAWCADARGLIAEIMVLRTRGSWVRILPGAPHNQ